jgi:hypothetical protein
MDAHAQEATSASAKPAAAELEAENSRLQRLVADLLIKNQQLRVELKAARRPTSSPGPFPGFSNN